MTSAPRDDIFADTVDRSSYRQGDSSHNVGRTMQVAKPTENAPAEKLHEMKGKGKHVTWEDLDTDCKQSKGHLLEDPGGSMKQGRKKALKGTLKWLLEQDRIYWESPPRQTQRSRGENISSYWELDTANDDISNGHGGFPAIPRGTAPWVPPEELSDSVNVGEDEVFFFDCSSDDESSNFGADMSPLEPHVSATPVALTTHQTPPTSVSGDSSNWKNHGGKGKVHSGEGRTVSSEKKERRRNQEAVLRAKCDVLRMEKDIAMQTWRQGCADMAQAAQMAHSLREAVETILEAKKRGTVSEPCTPRRDTDENRVGLAERIQRLRKSSEGRSRKLDSSMQRDLEHQAKALQERIDMLQRRSQFRNAQSSVQVDRENRGQVTGTRAGSSSELPLEVKIQEDGRLLREAEAKNLQAKDTIRKIVEQVKAETEQWGQVQEVLKHVSNEMTLLQQACEGWEKRALTAESLAATLQHEGDEWRRRAQTAQQKITELELQLAQLQKTVEEAKHRHALEQNRWLDVGSSLGSGNNLGYALVLQPIQNNSGINSCRCSTDVDGCFDCGNQCPGPMQEAKMQGERADLSHHANRTNFNSSEQDISGGQIPRFPSPFKSSSRETYELSKVRQKYHMSSQQWEVPDEIPGANEQLTLFNKHNTSGVGVQNCLPQEMFAADEIPRANEKLALFNKPNISRNGVERSLSQEGSRQMPPCRRPSPARIEKFFFANQENIGGRGSPHSTGTYRKGGGVRGQSSIRKFGQSPTPSLRGPSSPSPFVQRGHLKEIRGNIPVAH